MSSREAVPSPLLFALSESAWATVLHPSSSRKHSPSRAHPGISPRASSKASPLSCALSSSACSPLHGNTTFPLFHCLHILMLLWIIRSLSRTLISIECLHHCQINVLCSWTALQTVGRCRSSQKHRLTIVLEKWISVLLFRSLVKKITIRRASVSCKWSSLCYLRLQKPCAHPTHLRIKKKALISLNWLTWWLPKGLLQGLSTGHY